MLKQEIFWREHYHVLEKIRCSFFSVLLGEHLALPEDAAPKPRPIKQKKRTLKFLTILRSINCSCLKDLR